MNTLSANNLSVIIITRNRLDKLKRCLKSVRNILPQSEILIIDNGSTDGTAAFLRGGGALCEYTSIIMDTNVGVAAARNIGIRKSSKKFVLFLDDDAWIDQIDLQKIQQYFKDNPTIGIIAPRLCNPDGSVQESIRSFPTFPALLWRGSFLRRIFPNVPWYRSYILTAQSGESVRKVDWAIGACQIIMRDLFDQIGLLNEGYFFGYEDVDFCRRSKIAGYATLFWPDARIYHDYARTSSKGMNRNFFRHCWSIIRYFYFSSEFFR